MTDEQATAPASPDPDKPPLLDDLRSLGQVLAGSEIPGSAEGLHVLGAVVKVLEHAGLVVPQEIFPEPPPPVQRPEDGSGRPQGPDPQTLSRLERLEGALERVLGHLEASVPQQAEPGQPTEPSS